MTQLGTKRLAASLAACILILGSGNAAAQGDPDRGERISEQCAECHGPQGNSASPQFPRLAGQYADYIAKALEDYQTGARKNPIMAGFASDLSARDRKDLGAYYARQKGLVTITHFK